MRGLIIIILFLIVFVWLAFYSGKTQIKDLGYFGQASVSQTETTVPEPASVKAPSSAKASEGKPAGKEKTEEPSIKIDTIIIAGPKENEIIEGIDKIVFEFKARTSPEEIEEKIFFETKVEGLDNDWQKTYSEKRTVKFPAGPKEYTFLVRARTKDIIDPTPAQITFKINNSLYFGKIKISGVKIATSSQPSLITLSTNLTTEEKINLTGWQIKGKKGNFTIPKGIEKYNPFFETFNDIIIKKGDKIYLSSGQNPLGRGRNFRPNKCMGYLTQYFSFPISLNKNCPKPEKEDISYLSPCCKDFILKAKTCQTPNYSQNFTIATNPDCTSYIVNNLIYGGCYKNYSNDQDFLEKSWHIYLNKNIVTSNDWDTFYLRDKDGFFVAKYDYGKPCCK